VVSFWLREREGILSKGVGYGGLLGGVRLVWGRRILLLGGRELGAREVGVLVDLEFVAP